MKIYYTSGSTKVMVFDSWQQARGYLDIFGGYMTSRRRGMIKHLNATIRWAKFYYNSNPRLYAQEITNANRSLKLFKKQ